MVDTSRLRDALLGYQVPSEEVQFSYPTLADALAAADKSARPSPWTQRPGGGWTFDFNTWLGNKARDVTAGDVAEAVASVAPGAGELLSARDAYNSGAEAIDAAKRGDYVEAGLGAAGAGFGALGAFPLIGGMARGVKAAAKAVAPEVKGIRAYHGSPHNFDSFDMSKIGSGEGAQAYGHGLYFAENEGVARAYQKALTERPKTYDPYNDPEIQRLGDIGEQRFGPQGWASVQGIATNLRGRSWEEYAQGMEELAKSARKQENKDRFLRQAQIARGMSDVDTPLAGRMYQVNINADQDRFLDWDKPISEQTPAVADALSSLGLGADTSLTGGKIAPRTPEGARQFAEAGIPGVKYLDANSRRANDGTRNFVVFDDRIVSVVKKYGVPGAIGLGLITPEIGRQMQEQGL